MKSEICNVSFIYTMTVIYIGVFNTYKKQNKTLKEKTKRQLLGERHVIKNFSTL